MRKPHPEASDTKLQKKEIEYYVMEYPFQG
jgi:hypothetical protein